ncbi:DHS-like NAD/FAD-binding domain-containing protein [Apodospora peruviana]|uniref:DHS-like NAD/FAD-binding domain-containing protein n=1 Tax=Apodospora peruviana TaxID=516989 RepID=A0AAE0ILX4_9PEZI|nr:DHS-like NAD/FAD-binding domain-containing protein [Apodospora peruviana]
MAQTEITVPELDAAAVASFQQHLVQSNRIVAVIGAGLSAASGLATFRGTGGRWAKHDVFMVASPAGWRRDPGLVWQFYAERRRESLRASPNPAHHALAALAKHKPGFVALSQNVDGLLQRAGMVPGSGPGNEDKQLKLLHGNLFDLVCEDSTGCGYVEENKVEEPICEVLSEEAVKKRALGQNVMGMDVEDKPPKASALLFEAIAAKNKKILGGDKFTETAPTATDGAPLRELGEDAKAKMPDTAPVLHSGIEKSELPTCPKCKVHLLRPRVVWFGETLPVDIVAEVDALFEEDKIDLCLVIGTSSQVWPTAGFCERARACGAKVAWVNTRAEDLKSLRDGDWVFLGDAGVVLPEILGVYGQDTG